MLNHTRRRKGRVQRTIWFVLLCCAVGAVCALFIYLLSTANPSLGIRELHTARNWQGVKRNGFQIRGPHERSNRIIEPGNTNADRCKRSIYPASWELRADQITILVNGFAEARLPVLQRTLQTYSAASVVHSIYILWGNTSTAPGILNESLFTSMGAPIYIVRQESTSLNDRFLPRTDIKTRAVMICDDDTSVDVASLRFALDVWGENQDRIVGFFPRSHGYQLDTKKWVYIKHQQKYSIMLTKLMVIATEYLFVYTCKLPVGVREYVDEGMNCEDIAMNFVVACESGKGPLLVEGNPRDWGDNRNTNDSFTSKGLSARNDHMRDRGDCITAFHRFWNGMELRYSYTKAVSNLENPVYCKKFGYILDCNKQVNSPRDAMRAVEEHPITLEQSDT